MVLLTLGATWFRPARIFEYPGFMAFTFGVFIVPQAISLWLFPSAAPVSAVSAVLAMSCLCLACSILGYQLKPFERVKRLISTPVHEGRLLHAGVVFVAIGFFFDHLLENAEVQYSDQGGMTGIATIYMFFAGLVFPGFAICTLAALRRPALFTVSAALVSAWIPLQSILIGRREPAAMVALILGMGFYFQRHFTPPRWAIVPLALLAMLAIPATHTYRRLHAEQNWSGIRQIDLVQNFKRFVSDESILELRNAAVLMENTRLTGTYHWGADYWNHLVFRFVPAQLLGSGFKQSLMIKFTEDGDSAVKARMLDYDNPVGSTETGMGDSYQQFGWFGCLFFFVLAIFFRSLWEAAVQPEALFAQLFYMVITTSAMRAVTHWTLDFLPGLLYFSIFLGIAYLYARMPPGPALSPRRRPDRARERAVTREVKPNPIASVPAGNQ
jgi:hypothetical protein